MGKVVILRLPHRAKSEPKPELKPEPKPESAPQKTRGRKPKTDVLKVGEMKTAAPIVTDISDEAQQLKERLVVASSNNILPVSRAIAELMIFVDGVIAANALLKAGKP
ncbi:MAG: hypothetical protein ABT940_05730 [Alphaproteobacteria bacterium]